ncbi:MAG: ATP-binding cassette domain-containing protein [Desulfovibrionaceae bacterium]|nr:ATP-binding cassette domain-containing protein [Desulfovibrionaceae bacterium]
MTPLLEIHQVSRDFMTRRSLLQAPVALRAVREVSFTLAAGESVGLVGESGCGKSTVGRMAVGLLPPSAGTVHFAGQDIYAAGHTGTHLGQLQMVFQDPFSSFNPRWRVASSLAEPLAALGVPAAERHERVQAMLEVIGLSKAQGQRFPHEFSGGQRQRLAVARALITRPRVVVCDEPVSALDVSVQAQVLNLLRDLQERFQPAYLFISHNLAVVHFVCTRVLVMYCGSIVESLPCEALCHGAAHPYTQALLRTVPQLHSVQQGVLPPPLQGEVPSPFAPPSGCLFHPRCEKAQALCRQSIPQWRELGAGHGVLCHYA